MNELWLYIIAIFGMMFIPVFFMLINIPPKEERMATNAELREYDETYRKYYRGRKVEPEDIRALDFLIEMGYLRIYFQGRDVYAMDTELYLHSKNHRP